MKCSDYWLYIDIAKEQILHVDKKRLHKRIAAIIIQDNNVIGKGYNKTIGTFSIHAEVDAINDVYRRWGTKPNFKNCTMMIFRLDNNDDVVKCKPCNKCREALNKHKFKNVIFYY